MSLASVLCIAVTPLFGEEPAPTEPSGTEQKTDKVIEISDASFQAGLKALKDNLPDIAVNNFQKALKNGPNEDKTWPREQGTVIEQFLAEAYVRANKPVEALDIYSKLPISPANNYWTSIALIQQGSYSRAIHWLDQIPVDDAEWRTPALEARAYIADQLNDQRLLQASLEQLLDATDPVLATRSRIWLTHSLLTQKKIKQAADTLAPVLSHTPAAAGTDAANEGIKAQLDKLQPFAELTHARILTAQGNADEARLICQRLSEAANSPTIIKDLAKLTQAINEIEIEDKKGGEAQTAQQDNTPVSQTGEDRLLSFIAGRPDSGILSMAFDILIARKTFVNNPQAMNDLISWSRQSDPIRQPLAAYALADTYFKKNEPVQVVAVANANIKKNTGNPAIRKLILQTINYLVKQEQYDEATQLINSFQGKSGEYYFNAGIIAFEQKDYEKAAGLFDQAIKYAGDSIVRQAYHNANLNALAMGDTSRMAGYIKSSFLIPGLQEQLAYEQAHYSARNFEPQAIEKLRQFISSYSSSTLKVNAMLDLAEVALNLSPPQLSIARQQVEELGKEELNDDQKIRLACLNILIPESQEIWPEAIKACQQALKDFPTSKQTPNIHLKLGELLLKNENFNEALLVLQSFPELYPNSDLKEEAMFLAGKSAQLCDTNATLQKALDIFGDISSQNGKLAQSAIIETASILQERFGKSQEAIGMLQALLKNDLPKQTRLMALSIQAEAWASLNDDEHGTTTATARALCTEILDTPNLMPSWRYKALMQRGNYAAKSGNSDAALDDYYKVLSYFPNVSNLNRRDWYWYNQAGFAALHLLQSRQEWEKALVLAKQMAQSNGPDARKAANEARRIQYEHFIWNDSGDQKFREIEKQFFDDFNTNAPAQTEQ